MVVLRVWCREYKKYNIDKLLQRAHLDAVKEPNVTNDQRKLCLLYKKDLLNGEVYDYIIINCTFVNVMTDLLPLSAREKLRDSVFQVFFEN